MRRITVLAIATALIFTGLLRAQSVVWHRAYSGSVLSLVSAGTTLYIIVGSPNPGTGTTFFRSTDSGATWKTVQGAPYAIRGLSKMGDGFVAMSFIQPKARIWYSASVEGNWVQKDSFSGSSVSAMTVKDQHLFFIDYWGSVHRSDDTGHTWMIRDTGMPVGYIYSKMAWTLTVLDTNLYAGTDLGPFRSTNNGDTWIKLDSGLNDPTTVFAITRHDTSLFTAMGGTVYRASAKEPYWIALDNGLPYPIGSKAMITIDNAIYLAGTDGKMYRTTDDGNTWTDISSGLPTIVFDHFARIGNLLFASGSDGVYVTDISSPQNTVAGEEDASSLSIYPNPTYNQVTLNVNLEKPSLLMVSFFDLLGNKIRTLKFENLEQGNHAIPLSLHDLPAGTYYARLVTSYGEARTVKIVKE